jgi:hypothetical protein
MRQHGNTDITRCRASQNQRDAAGAGRLQLVPPDPSKLLTVQESRRLNLRV